MAVRKKIISLLIALALCANLIPLVSLASPVQAWAPWNKDASNPFSNLGLLSGKTAVIYDNGVYRMWYTKSNGNTSAADSLISGILNSAGSDLIKRLKTHNFSGLSSADYAGVKAVVKYLLGLNAAGLGPALQGIRPEIAYAESTDGVNWTPQPAYTFDGSGTWATYGVGSPIVVKTGANSYQMWFTGFKPDVASLRTLETDLHTYASKLTSGQIQDLINDLLVNQNTQQLLLELKSDLGDANCFNIFNDIINVWKSNSGQIGHATSSDGKTWTLDASPCTFAPNTSITWDYLGQYTPSVIYNSDNSYEMWYTGIGVSSNFLTSLGTSNFEDLIANAVQISVGRATSKDGINWTRATTDDQAKILSEIPGTATSGVLTGVAAPCVIKTGTQTYDVWLTGFSMPVSAIKNFITGGSLADTVSSMNMAIYHLYSINGGASWDWDGSNTSPDPLLTKGATGSWDALGVGFPSVVQIGSTYSLWYTGFSSNADTLINDILSGSSLINAWNGSGTKLAIGHAVKGPSTLVSIDINPPSATINAGGQTSFTAEGIYSDGSSQDITSAVCWTSSDTSVAVFKPGDPPGTVTGIKSGTVSIKASLGGITSSAATLTVNPATLQSITVLPANPVVALGQSRQFIAIGTYSDGSVADLTNLAIWSASGTSASMSSTTKGLALASNSITGDTTITAAYNSKSGSTTLHVISASITLSSIVVTLTQGSTTPAASQTVAAGKTIQYYATGIYSDSSHYDITNSVTWGVDNTTIARVNGAGLATGLKPGGTTNVTASATGATSGSASLTVSAATLESISVSPANPTLTYVSGKTTTLQFKATGLYSDGSTQDLTNTPIWSSSVAGAAGINTTSGLATLNGAGSTRIKAGSGSTTLTILADTTAPVIKLNTPTEGLNVAANSVTVAGSISGYPSSATVKLNGNPTALTLNAPDVNGNCTFSQNVSGLGPNNNSIVVEAVDAAGNKGSSGTRNVIFNAAKPTISITSFADGLVTNNPYLTVSGTANGTSSVTLRINGTAYNPAVTGGAFSQNITLTEGDNLITVSGYAAGFSDAAHLGTSGTRTVTLDTTPPTVTITSPVNGAIMGTPGLTVSGIVDDPTVGSVSLQLNSGTAVTVPVANGNFSQLVALVAGDNTITVSASDALGNGPSTSTVNVTYDSTVPGVTVTSPSNNLLTNALSQVVSGTIDDPTITSATLYVNGTPQTIAVVPSGSSGVFQQIVTLHSGNNTISVQATNNVNHTGKSGDIRVAVDTTAPSIKINVTDPTDSVTIDVLSSEDLFATPTVSVNSTAVVLTQVEARKWTGTYTGTSGTIEAGDYTVSVTGTDKAGNTGMNTAYFHKEVITVNPGTPAQVQTGNVAASINTAQTVSNADFSVAQAGVNPSGQQNPSGAASPVGIYLNINASADLRNNLSYIDLKISYDPATLPSNTDESSLRLYYWDTAQGIWQAIDPPPGVNAVDTVNHYIYGRLTHLSQYGAFGNANPAPTPPVYYGGGGGGGGTPASQMVVSGFTSSGIILISADGVIQSAAHLTTQDGKMTLDIAKGTRLLDSRGNGLKSLGATMMASPPPGYDKYVMVAAYEFGPDGAKFDPGITLTFKYDPASLPAGVDENSLIITYWDGSQWHPLGSSINSSARTVSATTTHFTGFAVLSRIAAPAPSGNTSEIPTSSPSPMPSVQPVHPVTSPAVVPTPPASSVPPTTTVSPTPQPARPPSAILLIIIIVVLFIVVCVLTVMIVLRRRQI